jgi:hypothetical protein
VEEGGSAAPVHNEPSAGSQKAVSQAAVAVQRSIPEQYQGDQEGCASV